jgi:hypothetical protein
LVAEMRESRPARRVQLLGQVEVAHGLADGGHLVVVVVDQEPGRQSGGRGLATQEAHAQRVEGRDPAGERRAVEQLLDARAHLRGGLVGEGDGQDPPGRHPALADEVRDAAGDHARLAAAGASEDQHRPVRGQHRLALLWVQRRHQGRDGRLRVLAHSTVTDFARFRGWSTSRPARTAT